MNRNRAGKSDRRESGIVQRLRKSVRDLPMQMPHVLLACSGGKDSVALAYLLAEMQRLNVLQFSLAHIHHGQHKRADHAANAVREIGRLLDVPVEIAQLEQIHIDAHVGVGLEESMRRERYLALTRIAKDVNADCIALAHHQTDQAETILLHLMRGAGVDGLAGMRIWEVRHVPWWKPNDSGQDIGIWRPLITESAELIADISIQSELPIVEDPTNIDPAYRRNAIRHQLLPVLESIAGGSTAAIARSAKTVAADAELLGLLTDQAFHGVIEEEGLSRNRLVALPAGMQERVIRAWVLRRHPQLELTADRVEALVNSAERNRGGSVVQLGDGLSVTLRDGMLTMD